jgi:hypothetical protein
MPSSDESSLQLPPGSPESGGSPPSAEVLRELSESNNPGRAGTGETCQAAQPKLLAPMPSSQQPEPKASPRSGGSVGSSPPSPSPELPTAAGPCLASSEAPLVQHVGVSGVGPGTAPGSPDKTSKDEIAIPITLYLEIVAILRGALKTPTATRQDSGPSSPPATAESRRRKRAASPSCSAGGMESPPAPADRSGPPQPGGATK